MDTENTTPQTTDNGPEEKPTEAPEKQSTEAETAAAPETEASGFSPTVLVTLYDKLLDALRGQMNEGRFHGVAKALGTVGHFGLIAAVVLAFFAGLITATKTDSFSVFISALGFMVLLTVLQYVAAKFLHAGDNLIKATPTPLGTRSFLDCVALLSVIGALAGLVWGIVGAANGGGAAVFCYGMLIFVIEGFFAWIALNPGLANTPVEETASAGEEAIGIISFFLKAFLRLVPVIFGAAVVLGALGLAVGTVKTIGAKGMELHKAIMLTQASEQVVAIGAVLPLVAFLLFLVYYLMLDVLRSILSLPGKLDRLQK